MTQIEGLGQHVVQFTGGTGEPHGTTVITLLSRVTAAVSAIARPLRIAPVFKPVLARDIIVPTNEVVVPKVVDDPTCQNTLQA